MIAVILKSGARVEIPNGAAVTATTLPSRPGDTPAAGLEIVTATGRVLAVFRRTEIAGYLIEEGPS